MAVFSDLEIKAAVKTGQIVIHPYVEENIKGSSVDVTLGEYYFTTEGESAYDFHNPFDEKAVKRYFKQPQKATAHAEWCKQYGHALFEGIPPEHPIIVLKPNERILAHSHEFIGINPPGTTEMRARSSWGRNGIASCFDAGWGDPGYINRWTMEVYNLNQHKSVPLPVGERIAQIVFHQTGEVSSRYGEPVGQNSKYQTSTKLEELIKSWNPEQMLPRAYKDGRKLPLPVDIV